MPQIILENSANLIGIDYKSLFSAIYQCMEKVPKIVRQRTNKNAPEEITARFQKDGFKSRATTDSKLTSSKSSGANPVT